MASPRPHHVIFPWIIVLIAELAKAAALGVWTSDLSVHCANHTITCP